MFYDKAKIFIQSGDGGDGMIGFRREKHVPYGGPSGGDGGSGGSVIFTVSPHLNSLIRFRKQVHYRAEPGKHGNTKRRTGANGDDVIIPVPPGTVIRDAETGDLLADMIEGDQEVRVLKGGRGGRGNIHFANSVNQAPRIAERGEPGIEMWVTMELKLIADVGIVGVPNAGKSTLLSVISAAQPKIANYPFTTLQPNLGVVTIDEYETMVFADIPGLIEGAADGIGLGHEFLRHVERTRVLVHLLDGASKEPLTDWLMINKELELYDIDLEKRPQLVVLNKMDLPDAIAWEPIIAEEVTKRGFPFHAISAVTGEGVREMLYKVKKMLADAPEPMTKHSGDQVITPKVTDVSFDISRDPDGSWRVSGDHIERIAAMTYFEFDSTLLRFQHILERIGISEALEEAGVEVGDTVHIGEQVLEWGE